MPASDAGLEPGPETACRAYPVEAEEALNAWMASKVLDEIWVSPAGWWYAAWMHRQLEVDQLQAQLAAQQAVVDAARAWRDAILESGDPDDPDYEDERILDAGHQIYKALRAIEAQAAQPEGEPR